MKRFRVIFEVNTNSDDLETYKERIAEMISGDFADTITRIDIAELCLVCGSDIHPADNNECQYCYNQKLEHLWSKEIKLIKSKMQE